MTRTVAALVAAVIATSLLALPRTSTANFSASTDNVNNLLVADTLEAPTGLNAVGGASVTLTWTPTSDTYADGHRVYRSSTPGGPYTQIAEVTPRTSASYVDSPAAGDYYYVVRAFEQSWVSLESNEASATVTSPSQFVSLDGGLGHTCSAKADGSGWCWGRNDKGQLGFDSGGADVDIPGEVFGSGLAEVVAGTSHSCGVKTDNTVWCWGLNADGQLGDNTTVDSSSPVQVVGGGGTGTLTGVATAAAGGTHSCAVKSDGTVWCWGLNDKGQLGDNTTIDSVSPVQVVGVGGTGTLTGVASITAGLQHTCAVKTDGTVWCWGLNDKGQLGDNTTDDSSSPVQVVGAGGTGTLTAVATAAAGEKHTCAVKTDNAVWCWGLNDKGQLGDNTTNDSESPLQVVGIGGTGILGDAVDVVAGLQHSCATRTGATMVCWGLNDKGQLGDATTTDSETPVQVVGPGGIGTLSTITVAGTGQRHTCAARTDDTVWCWGLNDKGQLGNNTTTDTSTPQEAFGSPRIPSLTVVFDGGLNHSCGSRADGSAWCWGKNDKGQIGIGGSGVDEDIPVQVVGAGGVGQLSNVSEVIGGDAHSCGSKTDGTVWCWGVNGKGQLGDSSLVGSSDPIPVWGAGLSGVASGGGGDKHSCLVKTDGTVWCWGLNDKGQLGDNTTMDSYSTVQVVGSGGTGVLSGVASVALGTGHTCAVKTDNTVWCWGQNNQDQLGDNTGSDSTSPVQVVGAGGTGVLSGVASVAPGKDHTCAAKSDGTVWCWGKNDKGQLGDGTIIDSSTPVQVVGGLTDASGISVGDSHTCAAKADGKVECWGRNDKGQLGDNSIIDSSTPVEVDGLTNATSVAAGQSHTCAVRSDETVRCWGHNNHGQLGDNTTIDALTPVQVVGVGGTGVLGSVAATSTGSDHTCATKTDATLWCWGHNNKGQLGDSTTTSSGTPVQTLGLGSVSSVAAGGNHMCAFLGDNTAWCWGNNDTGQIGAPLRSDWSTPVQVVNPGGAPLTTAATMAGGAAHSCAVKTDGTVWCWGLNDKGQLGDNTTVDSSSPVQVVGAGGTGVLTGVASVTAGTSHSCAVKTDNTVWCWGLNSKGQLGDNTLVDSSSPVQVVGPGGTGNLSGVATTAGGDGHTCVVKTDATVWCWGLNDRGQLGDGTTADSNSPVQVVGVGGTGMLADADDLLAGLKHSCVVRTDGTVACWGLNNKGQLGDGTTVNSSSPVAVVGLGGTGTLSTITDAGAGHSHTCASRTDATVWCWGLNADAQLGNNATIDSPTPVQAIGI